MSFLLFQARNYAESEVLAVRALEKFQRLDRPSNIYRCYNRLLLISKELGDLNNSVKYFEKSREYLHKSNQKGIEYIGLLNNLSLVYQKKGD